MKNKIILTAAIAMMLLLGISFTSTSTVVNRSSNVTIKKPLPADGISVFGHKRTSGNKRYCETWCCWCIVIHYESGISNPWPTSSTYPQDIMNNAGYELSLNGLEFSNSPQLVSGYTGVYKVDDGNGPVMYYMEEPENHTTHNDGSNSELLRLIRNQLGIN